MKVKKGYGYDDLLLQPRYSELDSRNEPDISTVLDSYLRLDVPIISAAMDTVTNAEMAEWITRKGGLGIVHRYQSIEAQAESVRFVKQQKHSSYLDELKVGAATGVSMEHWSRAEALVDAGVDLLVIDVAHGDTKVAYDFIRQCRATWNKLLIMSGNIATPGAARRAAEAGCDVLRVGIGPGSACTTRLVAGVGVPMLSAISDIKRSLGGYPLVADGGIKHSGDIVKALAAGADAVMMGGRFAGYPQTPQSGVFRGMASYEALFENKGEVTTVPEGATFNVATLSVDESETDWRFLINGIRHGLGYLGAKDLQELRARARWIRVSDLGHREGQAHFRGMG